MVAGILILASCNKNIDVTISNQFTANFNLLPVVSNLKYTDSSLVFPSGQIDSASVILSYIIFDNTGNSVTDQKLTLSSFAATPTIKTPLSKGNYTVVSCAYIYADGFQPYTLNNETNLNNYKILFDTVSFGYYTVLGFYKQNITVNNSQTISINMNREVGFINLYFQDLIKAGIDSLVVFENFMPVYLDVNTDTSHIWRIPSLGYYVYEITTGYDGGIFGPYPYFPSSQFNFEWFGYDASGNLVNSGTIPSSPITAGELLTVNINALNGTYSNSNSKSAFQNSMISNKLIKQRQISAQRTDLINKLKISGH